MVNVRTLPMLSTASLKNTKVLLRVDLNVPIVGSEVRDSTRIERIIPTVNYLVSAGAKVIMISHLGRPKAQESEFSLRNIVDVVCRVLSMQVVFIPSMATAEVNSIVDGLPWGSVVLLENLRFFEGETKNDMIFSKQLSSFADIYVNDAFSCSHRKHASVDGVTKILPSFSGFSLQEELKHIDDIVNSEPAAAIIGGAKASTKIPMLCNLASKVNFLILGGGLSNTFLSANGFRVGSSVFEQNNNQVWEVMEAARSSGCKVICPIDHIVAHNLDGHATSKLNCDLCPGDAIYDIGEKTSSVIQDVLEGCKTIFWNGPLGVFERKAFASGTARLLEVIIACRKKNNATTIIGGGDSIFAMNSLGYNEKDFSYVSTGGGALLHFLSTA
ncbi:MAG: phosphoglycerate kinase [Aaplasma endosymbiont of Hyalomma asiaticum]